MSISESDKQRVFLAYRAIFAGENALLRKSRKIHELVQKHKQRPPFQHLVQEFGFENIVNIVKDLLARQIFQSNLRAKLAFPDLFQVSPVQEVQRAASERDAVRSQAEAIQEIAASESKEQTSGGDEIKEHDETETYLEVAAVSHQTEPNGVPSLYPLYLPYKAQHAILTSTQRLLEECCFEFMTKWLPSKLSEKGWECAEAVELTKWTKILQQSFERLPVEALDLDEGTSIADALLSNHRLRHSAVHRLPTTARSINDMIASALKLAKTLRDPLRAAQLEELQHEIERKIKDMELNKNFLEDRLDKDLREIQRQREELNRREKDLIATMLREDQENKSLIGTLLQDSLQSIFSNMSVSAEGQGDTNSTDEKESPNGIEER